MGSLGKSSLKGPNHALINKEKQEKQILFYSTEQKPSSYFLFCFCFFSGELKLIWFLTSYKVKNNLYLFFLFLQFNCFLLMPVVDKLPALLKEDLESVFLDDLDSIFNISQLKHSLGQRKRDMEIELKRVCSIYVDLIII